MRTSSKRTSLVLDAIDLALAQLAKMPDSVEVRAWRVKAVAYEADAKDWSLAPPTAEQREAMMKKILGLHVAVTKLREPRSG
jgi:hypothetical protein